MNRGERLARILDMLAATGRIDVDEIVETLRISPATARRDLDSLAEQNLLTRARGGAVAHSVAYDLPLRYRRQPADDAKQRIAAAASRLVPHGAVVAMGGGTTTTAIADALSSRADIMKASAHPNLTVVTNALNIAAQLAMRPQIKTVVTGGVVHSHSYELVGSFTDAVLTTVTLDFAFIGANGFDPRIGPTTHDEREASISTLMASRASRAVLVIDSSKMGKRTFATMGDARVFGTLITDDGITAEQHTAAIDHGYEVIVA